MPRDNDIKKTFEIADDGMQGVIGYFFYVLACKNSADTNTILSNLPKDCIHVTHEWVRFYKPIGLTQAMKSYFEPYHARVCLISVISLFEGALKNFIERLYKTRKINRRPKNNYKRRLEWAFEMALKSDYGSKAMIARIPDLCLHVDHARRIRNLWMHNNGLYDSGYEKGISLSGRAPIIESSYQEYKKAPKKKIPVILKPEGFLGMSLSHIELLHQLHYYIQKKYFGQKKAYSYKALKKGIEWHRLLIGL